MHIVRAADCRRMPWKNGGGETLEIATSPEGAGLDAFTWRLSMARVAQDGPFSMFAGVDRTLAVLSGQGLDLQTAGTTVRLGPGDVPLSFPGDQPTEGRLIGGPVDDLNVMTRRSAVRHRMRGVQVEGALRLALEGAILLVFCAEGSVGVDGAALTPRDTAILAHRRGSPVQLDGAGMLYLIEIEPAA